MKQFKTWLERSKTSQATLRQHWGNLEFVLNHFLLYIETLTAEEGISKVGEFRGWWSIRKAMWASKSSIKSNATSLTEFYTFLVEEGLLKPEELAALKQQVKAELPKWLEALERYDDPEVELDASA